MKKSIVPCVATLLSVFCLYATAETLTPLKGQSPETVQQDISACQAQSGSSNNANTTQSGGRIKGAATGAVAGATVAGVRSNRHDEISDRVDSDVKQEYRQNKARNAAAAGAVVG
ncbi:hypothetical protein GIW69_16985, partial [Pseudomonas syringae]|nr:hypothetical protein [Pseudomonas syringae]